MADAPLLFQHQLDGAMWLSARPRALLADAPGVGKTRTLLYAAKHRGNNIPTVICPAMVRQHWKNEGALLGMDPNVLSYDRVALDGGLSYTPDILILDESHRAKSVAAKRSVAILGKNGVARSAKVVWAASGTPMPKHPGEIWPLVSALFDHIPRMLGISTYAQWIDRFCEWHYETAFGETKRVITGGKNLKLLRDLLAPNYLRRELSALGMDVPELWFQVRELDASPVQYGIDWGNRQDVGLVKTPYALVHIREFLQDNPEAKALVFAQHRAVIADMAANLAHFGVVVVHGDVTDAHRIWAQQEFNAPDLGVRVFIGQNDVCKEGIALTGASHAFLVEPSWTAATNWQLGSRMTRHGQTARRCVAEMLTLANTSDEAVVRKHCRETQFMAQTVQPSTLTEVGL